MAIEQKTESEPSQETKPSYLHLFNYLPEKKQQIREEENVASNFVHQFKSGVDNLNSRYHSLKKANDRLMKNVDEVDENRSSLVVSLALGYSYQILKEDFPYLSNNQILELFKQCIVINIKSRIVVEEFFGKLIYPSKLPIDAYMRHLFPIREEASKSPPDWFKGEQRVYAALLDGYSMMQVAVTPWETYLTNEVYFDHIRQIKNDRIAGKNIPVSYKDFNMDNLPDWCNLQTPPTDEIVQLELDVDQRDFKEIQLQREHMVEQSTYLVDTYAEKSKKTVAWFSSKWDLEIKRSQPTLAYLLIFLQASQIFSNRPLSQNDNEIFKWFIGDESRISDPEMWSLCLENILSSANVIDQGRYTKTGVNTLRTFLHSLSPDASPEEINAFRIYRVGDKKAFQSLNYDLSPLLKLLEPDEIGFLDSLVQSPDLENQNPEQYILGLAGFLSSAILKIKTNPDKVNILAQYPVGPALKQYNEFVKKFMGKNWRWAYQQLQFALNSSNVTRVSDIYVDLPTVREEPQILADELEEDISRVEKGGLGGWNVRYSLNGTLNNIDLVTIAGETLQEKGEFLKDLFVAKGISCSTDPSNVISALERKTTSSRLEEQLAPPYMIKDIEFKRKRVGPVRVFYRMDQVQKQMVFWVYQKQANGYDFTGL